MGEWYLVRTPESLKVMSFDFSWCGPSFRRAQDDHGPTWPDERSVFARSPAMFADLAHAVLDVGGHCVVHFVDVGTFDEIRGPAVPAEEVFEFLMRDASQQRRIVDLVSVDMEDRQDGAIARRIQELIDVPGGREWSCF